MTTSVQARMRISRVHCNQGGDFVSLELEDTVSGVHFASAEMAMDDFAQAMFGMSRPLDVKLRGINLIGATPENKTVFVPDVRATYSRDDAAAKAAIAPFEVDGWRGRLSDFGNHHKSTTVGGQKGYMVIFSRFVRDGVPVND